MTTARQPRRARQPVRRESATGPIHRIALLGNHIPRQCGIATFTTDLAEALTRRHPDIDCLVLAMNEADKRHAYPERLRFEIAENDLASYRRAADFLNVNTVDVTCVQHEYGIFGGDVNNVTFPCGYTLAPDGDTIHLYYGAADSSVALAHGSVRRMLSWLDRGGQD